MWFTDHFIVYILNVVEDFYHTHKSMFNKKLWFFLLVILQLSKLLYMHKLLYFKLYFKVVTYKY